MKGVSSLKAFRNKWGSLGLRGLEFCGFGIWRSELQLQASRSWAFSFWEVEGSGFVLCAE